MCEISDLNSQQSSCLTGFQKYSKSKTLSLPQASQQKQDLSLCSSTTLTCFNPSSLKMGCEQFPCVRIRTYIFDVTR